MIGSSAGSSRAQQVVAHFARAGLPVEAGAVAELASVIVRGEENFARSGRGVLSHRDVDELAERMVATARELDLERVGPDSVRRVMGVLCPGFFPWC